MKLTTYYFMSGTKDIYEEPDTIFETVDDGKVIARYKGGTGGWNNIDNVYFTPQQCALGNKLSSYRLVKANQVVTLHPVKGDQDTAEIDHKRKLVMVGCHTFPFSDVLALAEELRERW